MIRSKKLGAVTYPTRARLLVGASECRLSAAKSMMARGMSVGQRQVDCALEPVKPTKPAVDLVPTGEN